MVAVICVVSFACIAAVAWKGYRAYESHLSSDVRRILTAALDPGANIAEIRIYERDASLAVHTQRDRDLEAKFEKLVALTEENCAAEESSMKSARAAATGSLEAVATYLDAPPVAGSRVEEMDTAVDNARKAFDRYLACEARVNHDRGAISGIMDDLRAALSMPPKRHLVSATPPK